MNSQRLFKLLVAMVMCAASVGGISSTATASVDDVFGLSVSFQAEGNPNGIFDAQYLTIRGDGVINLALRGHDFTEGSSQEITLHKGNCSAPGAQVDRFEVDPTLRILPLDPNPRVTSVLGALLEGTPGALRYESGSVATSIAVGDVASFELDYVIVVNEIGSGLGDYFCGVMSDRVLLGTSGSVGTTYPLIFKDLNGSGVSASGSATLLGNIVELDLHYDGLNNLVGAHFQLFRQGASCPTSEDATELEIGGSVELALTDGQRSLLPADALTAGSLLVHPAAAIDGSLSYAAQIALTDDQVAAFGSTTVLIHGFDQDGNGLVDGGPSPVDPGLSGDESAVAGCGQFSPMPPSPPTDVSATVASDTVTVTWDPPAEDGGSPITEYIVSLSSEHEVSVNGAATEAVIEDLDDGTYRARVVAVNDAGSSQQSEASLEVEVSRVATPEKPGELTVRVVRSEVFVSWSPPANAEDADIDGYEVTLSTGPSVVVEEPHAEFSGHTDGPVSVTVRAFNAFTSSSVTASASSVTDRDCQDTDLDSDWEPRVGSEDEGAVFRLYCAYFLRYPDDEGYSYWIDVRNGGADLTTISDLFASSEEFAMTYGDLSNDEYVRLLYGNVLLRPVDPDGYEYWKDLLDSKELTKGETMLWVTQGQEFRHVTGTP